MKDADLRKIMNFIGSRVRKLIPWSDNLDSSYQRVNRATLNRYVQLRAQRSWLKSAAEKAQLRKISFWNLDLNSDDLNGEDSDYLRALREKIRKYPQHKEKTQHKNGEIYTAKERLEENAARAIFWQIGNCGETADLAIYLYDEYPENGDFGLPEVDTPVKVELIDIHSVHSFELVNRPGHTDIKEPETFLNAYIHDVHTGEKYQIKEVLIENKKFQYSDEIFKYIQNWKVLAATYIGANSLHSQRWYERTHNPDKAHKWWKRGEFLRMPDQVSRGKQNILEYDELVNQLIEKCYEVFPRDASQKLGTGRVLKPIIDDFDGRDIELLNHAKIVGITAASLVLDDIMSHFKNKTDTSINKGKMTDSGSESSSSENEVAEEDNQNDRACAIGNF